ncbi:uncharacterized protein BDCG_17943 [Blastomyces dermatitidis ER-3]|uniref:Uncharacterized protein n=3 Tax=Blastomyces TaxID=229219 RepID=A0A179UYS9_BLAGS|nr:uncharacterized protein BDBG_17758 [Blastomyces gilchristii SLH14081]XP_045282864.1 uncharacterized protein BDCG_17943 [Blastomyces dermatitidis ER-3]EQL28890.1 hypothetical protein BDFG_08411 [Blastomyces dermatitidis ATCC 26199]KMW69140.1 hypothetical protein BDDG_13310 [Blastomyces dermatitidis ATCC 18188]OAT03137.1 hypothetical protein BDCG_17943 [Blastomyces dermatitidis ER-3]OAT13234.1 hypothetical protein BDBG_17758 [Blastomyces gilchristii SLH14081]
MARRSDLHHHRRKGQSRRVGWWKEDSSRRLRAVLTRMLRVSSKNILKEKTGTHGQMMPLAARLAPELTVDGRASPTRQQRKTPSTGGLDSRTSSCRMHQASISPRRARATERQIDLLLRDRNASDISGKHNWKDIRVVGELKKPKDKIRSKSALLQMARYVRDVTMPILFDLTYK